MHNMNAYWADGVCLSVCRSEWFNSRTAEQSLMKFGMNIMQLKATKNSNFEFPTIGNTNMADERTCEVGSTLELLNIGSCNNVRL
jgi:hypothetical protein